MWMLNPLADVRDGGGRSDGLGGKYGPSHIFLDSFSTIRTQNRPLQVVLPDVLMLPTGCPNSPTRSGQEK